MSDRLLAGAPDIPLAALLVILMIAAVIDIRSRQVPNTLVLTGLAATLVLMPIFHLLPFTHALAGSVAGLLIFLPFYIIGLMGAGDVKLLAIVGSVLGPSELIQATIHIFIAGGIVTVLYLIARRSAPPSQNVPYAVAIALGIFSYLAMGSSSTLT
jgi:prepilin peptidase CpaA